ncbi:MAG: alpha-amylase family glycosyl hydrolase [Ilumatobacteraceae bacterium]
MCKPERVQPQPGDLHLDLVRDPPPEGFVDGARWDAGAGVWCIGLWSAYATGAEVVVVDRQAPQVEVLRRSMARLPGTVDRWTASIAPDEVGAADAYGFVVSGSFAPLAGHRFDPAKVLVDPYARQVWFPPGADRDLCRVHGEATLGHGPLALLPPRAAPPLVRARRRVAGHELVMYELHVGHFTKSPSSGVDREHRGRFAGVIDKIPYLRDLGVTGVELLPVQQFDPGPEGTGRANVWGYMPVGFGAVHDAYATGEDAAAELAELAGALHRAGIQLWLDVVFNHTTEEDPVGPTYHLRGIDHRSYYVVRDDGSMLNDAGCGNVVRAAHPAAQRLIAWSLQRFADLGVDGFRFDLATLLGRDEHGRVQDRSPLLDAITDWAAVHGVALVAEAWDLGAYQLGRAFPGQTWGQWNGRFRDDVRAFWRGDEGKVAALATRVQGSPDLFHDSPRRSVNFLSAHDGFTLHDWVAYDHPHNYANGHGGRDGHDDNWSWNHGWEGEHGAPRDVVELRERQLKNAIGTLMLSAGIPMLLGGDEIARTQRGNNNAYNVDDDTTWVDWGRLAEWSGLHRFVRNVIALRKQFPGIGAESHWGPEVSFHGPEGPPDWSYTSRSLAWHLRGAKHGHDDLFVVGNAWWGQLEHVLPAGGGWRRVVDTSLPSPRDVVDAAAAPEGDVLPEGRYPVGPRSLVVLRRPGDQAQT